MVTGSTHDDGLSSFMNVRPRLFGVAYRILRSAAAAEDTVQDVWLRWQTTDRRKVVSPAAFLITATTRLALNTVQSARARRELSADPSLPEPVDAGADPGADVERRDALNDALHLLLERLSPTERAAYVLREAFTYPYRRIGDVLAVEEANARQIVTRARARVTRQRQATANATERRHLFDAFVTAARTGELGALEHLLAAPVVSRHGAPSGL